MDLASAHGAPSDACKLGDSSHPSIPWARSLRATRPGWAPLREGQACEREKAEHERELDVRERQGYAYAFVIRERAKHERELSIRES